MLLTPRTQWLIFLIFEVLFYAAFCLRLITAWSQRRSIEKKPLVVLGTMWILITLRLVHHAQISKLDLVNDRSHDLRKVEKEMPFVVFDTEQVLYLLTSFLGHGFLVRNIP
ncbi:hypothetical protein PM082_018238 [Marasmius tenuissimus]|nr:hypothetical protein PM082_018238 [Marasmius tenuissimus]